MNFISKIGHSVTSKFASVPYTLGYAGRVFKSAFFFMSRGKAAYKILIMQLLFTFIEALPLITILGAGIGSAIYLGGYNFLMTLGQANLIHKVLVIVLVQELGPLLVAFVVTARSATAIATELGTMVTTHQIESYISIGVDPISYLVAPRFIGVTLSVFFLNLYFAFSGLLGPKLIAQLINPVMAAGYLASLFKEISIMSIIVSSIKSLIYGMIISITATLYGFNVERASTEVPVAGINAVANSFLGIFISTGIIDVMFYMGI